MCPFFNICPPHLKTLATPVFTGTLYNVWYSTDGAYSCCHRYIPDVYVAYTPYGSIITVDV